jgi:hypothetical protein
MSYRKVGYLEQCYYIIRYKIKEIIKKVKGNVQKILQR